MAILNTYNQDFWIKTHEAALSTNPKENSNKFSPIPDYDFSTPFSSHSLLVRVLSMSASPSWRLACYLEMHVDVQSFGRCYVGNQVANFGLSPLRFPKLSEQFRLKLIIPKYHKDLNISIWSYTGPERDSIDLIEQTLINLAQSA